MPKAPLNPLTTPPPWPTAGGEYVLDGGEIKRVNPPIAPGCDTHLGVATEIDGGAANLSPEAQA